MTRVFYGLSVQRDPNGRTCDDPPTGAAAADRRETGADVMEVSMIGRSLSFGVLCALAIVHGSLAAQSAPAAIPLTSPDQAWPPAGVVQMCHCDRDPVLVRDKKPSYTQSAMDAKIQGTVEVEAVVETNGKVSAVRVVRSLDKVHGLDDEASRR